MKTFKSQVTLLPDVDNIGIPNVIKGRNSGDPPVPDEPADVQDALIDPA
jgi:hypothetical protein